jgi:GT2 family glycosyltransferase
MRAFEEVGLFDQKNFPHYKADFDFSLRAGQAGYGLLIHPACYLYSKTKLTGLSNLHKRISFSSWIKSFGSIKSPNNLKIRLRFALRHAPLLCFPSFVICDLGRLVLGTLRNQLRNGLALMGPDQADSG